MMRLSALSAALLAASVLPVLAQDAPQSREERRREAAKTEYYEPVPPTVETPEGRAPSDAIVLFDGTSLDAFAPEKGETVAWAVADGAMTVAPGKGGVRTKESFCDVQLHVEWRSPVETDGFEGQDRGNSGIFLQELYEVQVLDSHENPTYVNGQAASVYKQHPPLANASRAPGEWQTYDIVFKAPRFAEGRRAEPGYVTVFHNGVLVQNHAEIQGTTEYIGPPREVAHGCAPIFLQDHDSKVSYRNMWVRKL